MVYDFLHIDSHTPQGTFAPQAFDAAEGSPPDQPRSRLSAHSPSSIHLRASNEADAQMWRGVPLPRPLEGRLLVRRRTTHRAEAELKALRGAAELGVGVAEGFPHLARRAEAGRAENERFVQTPGHLPQTLHGTAIYAYIDPQNHLN